MKTIIISLLLVISVNAQNVWYVDRDATGANTGRSWEDAWTSLDSSVFLGYDGVNWAIIGDGDTIYVSGGTDSTCYVPLNNNLYNGIRREIIEGEVTPTFNETVIVAPAWNEGHNGKVYFTTKDDNTYNPFVISGVNNVKIIGFNIIDSRSNNLIYDAGMLFIYGDNITIENCYFYSRGLTTGIYMNGYNQIVKNCIYNSEQNDLINDVDPFGLGGRGNHTIDGNIIIVRNTSLTTSSHRDMIQIGEFDDKVAGDTVDVIIKNNLILLATVGSNWNGMIYSSGSFTNTNWYIYNNVIVSATTASDMGGIFIYQSSNEQNPPGTYRQSYYIFNNTMILNDNGTGSTLPYNIGAGEIDTIVLKNNITVMDANPNMWLALESFIRAGEPYDSIPYFREVDHNAYSQPGGISGEDLFYSGERFGAYTLNQWLATGYDANSLFGNSAEITFDNKFGETREDYYTTTGRGLGVNMAVAHPELYEKFPDIKYDALGNPRGSAWDIGALQYQGGQPSNINLKSRLFLQGPYSTNLMSTNISQNGLLPNSQPFSTSPWNYNGNEILNSGSTSNFVDWVLVELRNNSNPTEVVSRKAAILNNDGTLLNTDGSIGVPFNNVDEGSYYIAVFHRNHLALMSAIPVQLTANSQLYDFTTDMNKAYGVNPMKDLGGGKFGMFAGDGNSNGGVTISDRNEVWAPQNGTVGYLKGDFDLDGGVTVNDVNLYWNINNGTMTQVP